MAAREEHLPGIDNAPELYEVKATINAKQPSFPIEADVEEDSEIDFAKSLDRFHGSRLRLFDANGVPVSLSDRYHVEQNETMFERFRRLKSQVDEFAMDVQEANAQSTFSSRDLENSSLSAVELVDEVNAMVRKLSLAEQLITPETQNDNSTRQLINKLREFQNKSIQGHDEAENMHHPGHGRADGVTYELYYKPNVAAFTHASQVAELETRLNAIEQALGSNISQTVLDLGRTMGIREREMSLSNLLSNIADRFQYFDENKMNILRQKCNELQTSMHGPAGSVDMSPSEKEKLNVAYDLLMKQDNDSELLPDVIDRLQTLRCAHEETVGLANTIASFEEKQSHMVDTVQHLNELLTQVDSGLAVNMDTTMRNVQSLLARMDQIR
eukprot:CFRG4805T1